VKKTIIFISIIIVSVAVGFGWSFMENYITKFTHPMPDEYRDTIKKYSEEYGVPEDVIYAVIKCESSFRADAKSASGAIGLMQIMPDTFRELCGKKGEEYNESFLYDPDINIKYGTIYLSDLFRMYNVWETVYAAYNAGYGRVNKWMDDQELCRDGRLTTIPFEETEKYVERVVKAREVYSDLIEKERNEIETVVSYTAKEQ